MIPVYFVISGKNMCPCQLQAALNLYREKLYGLPQSIMEFKKKRIYISINKIINESGKYIISCRAN